MKVKYFANYYINMLELGLRQLNYVQFKSIRPNRKIKSKISYQTSTVNIMLSTLIIIRVWMSEIT